jgi:YHS domain-containing protein/thiol-disulfide isomerase/thioredoxin
LLSWTTHLVGAEGSFWRSDFKAALKEAEEKKLPLIVHFYADWCMPCQRMEREVFTKQAVKDVIGSRFVAVKVNSDHHQDLVKQYGVDNLPSDVFVDPLNGRTISINSGYQDQSAYLTKAAQAEARFQKAQPAGVKVEQGELGEAFPVVGLDGYSPVALMKKREWNRGSSKFSWDYKDVTYYLTSREELMEFRENPESFAPRLLGCDPVILWESDKAVAGDIRFGAFFDDELYLFKSDERRRQFKSSPEKYIRLQHALKVDQIERTAMR